MSAQNQALMRRWFDEVWNHGRPEAVDEMLSGQAVVHGMTDAPGPAAFKAVHAMYRRAFPDLRIDVDQIVCDGDVAAARWHAVGTHSGDGLGVPPTGRSVRFSGMTFARIEGGMMVEGWNNFDHLGLLQQLGLAPAPGA